MRKCTTELPYVLGILFFNNAIIAKSKQEVDMKVKVGGKRKIT
jgi:hypothetical protein